MATPTRLTPETLKFIQRASRQKKPDWLDRNREEYEALVQHPLMNLVQELKRKVGPSAKGYHFPQRGLARLKRSARGALEYGAAYRDYVSYSVSRPAESRFDKNPNLFFMIHPDDEDGDEVLVAGGLYAPSSRQLRAIREAIANDARPFERLFASKGFADRFPDGFSDERKSTRAPRGFDPNHPRMEWLKLQGFFVWRSYRKKEYTSSKFPELVAKDWLQVLRLNGLLEQALQGRFVRTSDPDPSDLSSRLAEVEAPRRQMDF